ncbi:MFS transporter [Streptosporangium sp. NPDC051023]|uniref:MFS transporter n=1 Tax=Streptosporangium sp. NPDC051023 TaxID=3155410 RepID=UPI00344F7F20
MSEVVQEVRPSGLWTRDFTLYFVGRTVSLSGGAMVPITLSLAVLKAGHGVGGIGYVLGAQLGAMALTLPFGGVLAHRHTPRRVMIGSDTVRVVLQIVMASLFAVRTPDLMLIVALSTMSGCAGGLFQPGATAIVPQLAGDVQRSNAALRLSQAVTTLAGPSLAGALTVAIGVSAVFTVNAVTFAVSAACLYAVRGGRADAPAAHATLLRELREGWQEFRSRTWLWSVLLVWTLFGLLVFGPFMTISTDLVTSLHGPVGYGVTTSAFGGGMIIGGLLGLWLKPARPLAVGAAGLLLFVPVPFTVAAGMSLPVLVLAAVGGGTGFAFWSVMWATTVQTRVPADALSRVAAYDVAGSMISIPLGRMLVGPLTMLTGLREVLYLASALAAASCLCLLLIPSVRRMTRAPDVT